jgi:hypothetical protein
MRRVFAVMLVLALALVVAGWGSSIPTLTTAAAATTELSAATTTAPVTLPTVPAGSITLQGDSISLALPPTFTGGNPADPAVAAAYEQAFGVDIHADEELSGGLREPLAAWSEPGPDGFRASVSSVMEPNQLSASMDEVVKAFSQSYSGGQFNVESLASDRAYVLMAISRASVTRLCLM